MSIEIFSLYFIGLMGALIPGPDILFIIRTTLSNGRIAGFVAASGVLFASLFYLSLVGFGLKNIGHNPYFQLFIGLFGSIYLLYISFSIWNATAHLKRGKEKDKRLSHIFLKGIVVHLSNPKAIIFFSVILAPFLHSNILVFQIGVLTLGHITSFFGVAYGVSKMGNFFTDSRTHITNRLSALLFIFFSIELLKNSYEAFLSII